MEPIRSQNMTLRGRRSAVDSRRAEVAARRAGRRLNGIISLTALMRNAAIASKSRRRWPNGGDA